MLGAVVVGAAPAMAGRSPEPQLRACASAGLGSKRWIATARTFRGNATGKPRNCSNLWRWCPCRVRACTSSEQLEGRRRADVRTCGYTSDAGLAWGGNRAQGVMGDSGSRVEMACRL